MSKLIAKIVVFCLLLLTVHTASGGGHSPVHDPSADIQVQSVLVVQMDEEKSPVDGQKMKSECSICHAAHMLVALPVSDIALSFHSRPRFHVDSGDSLASHIDDISHPPIRLS